MSSYQQQQQQESDQESLLKQANTLKPPPMRAYNASASLLTKVLGSKAAPVNRVSESLDYEPIQNKVFYDKLRVKKDGKKKLYGYTGHTLAKFIVTLTTGVVTGLFAVGLSFFVNMLTELKLEMIQTTLTGEEGGHPEEATDEVTTASFKAVVFAFLKFWVFGSGLVTIATAMVQYWAPAAAGAGVTLVMAYLNGNHIPNLLRVSTLITKFVGTICSVSAGLPMGPEACSFWSRKTAWRCFIAATLSTFTIQVINHKAVHGAISPEPGSLKAMEMKDWGMQLPFFLINFAMAGLLGAAFNSLRMWLWKLRAAKTRHLQRIFEVIGLVFLVGLCGFFFSWTAGTCIELPESWWINKAAGKREYGMRFFCSETEHNDVATLFLSGTHHTIVSLFSMGKVDGITGDVNNFTPHFTPGGMALFTCVYLVLMSIGAGLAIPAGLFMPSIVVGGAWGGLWGVLVRQWLPNTWNVQPGLYALLAATGVLGGVFRSAISLVVLMVEGTQGIQFLPGVILAVVVANWVAHHIHHDGVYESELERIGNVYMLRDEPPHRLHTLTTEAIMATGVVGVRSIENVGKLLEILRNTTHNGFPVYVRDDDPESGEAMLAEHLEPSGTRLEGLVLRSQLLVLLQRRHFCDEHGRPVGRDLNPQYELDLENEMRTFFRRYYTHSRYISATPAALNDLNLLKDSNDAHFLNTLYLDLRPFMNRAPFTIRKDSSAGRAHQVFVSLGLRHLIVVDAHFNVVGIITRKDLDHAAGHGWWRLSHQAEPPNTLMSRGMGFFKKIVGGSTRDLTQVPQLTNGSSTLPQVNGHAGHH
ncbi:uncharacterized protein HaLaN_04991 [Haematococcus lacustris]|uniref:Chloride channel protein n=1 Tax=Haematococcus lacustris TaxID=44745 RepID=A0A699Z309_HAELA|nr:uncharacterized protein HaLaN_04991 [Haematococcus lacustris]